MKNIEKYIDRRFSPDQKLCEDEAYRAGANHFTEILSILERKHPEDSELILQLIVARAVLETNVGRHMFRKGLNNKWKVCPRKREKGK